MIRPFEIHVDQTALDDLGARLRYPRWPDQIDGAAWRYGTNREYLQRLTAYWHRNYNWRANETKLNALAQFTVEVGGTEVHALHVLGKGPNPKPLLLVHGWPDSFFRFVKLIPLLTDPANHGGNAEDAFTVIVPDIPGFGFSRKPTLPGTNTTSVAGLFAELMTAFGYDRFFAHGGDFGASITEQLGLQFPDRVSAIHLTNVPPQHARLSIPDLTPEEQAYLRRAAAWDQSEGAYAHLHATKPETASFGLNDSPIGLAAWIVEKLHDWSDCNGDLETALTADEILTNVSIYWFTQTIGSSMRFYYEKAHRDGPPPGPTYVDVPTGFASFVNDIEPAPRRFAERFFNVQYWIELPHGGHFAALEVPHVLARQLRDFFRPYRDHERQ